MIYREQSSPIISIKLIKSQHFQNTERHIDSHNHRDILTPPHTLRRWQTPIPITDTCGRRWGFHQPVESWLVTSRHFMQPANGGGFLRTNTENRGLESLKNQDQIRYNWIAANRKGSKLLRILIISWLINFPENDTNVEKY